MNKLEDDPDFQQELQKAFAIFKEDHVVQNLAALKEHLLGTGGNPADGGDDKTEGTSPPKSDPKPSNKDKQETKRGWWSNYE